MTSHARGFESSRGEPRARRAVWDERMLIAELVAAHIEGVEFARELMTAQEAADDLEHAVGRAIDTAAENPDDPDAADVAVATASAADEACEAELRASINWASHVKRVERLVRAARLEDHGQRGARAT